ncbi:MAG TPA: hypothetical protein PLL92_01345 [Alicycliphilus sp.]|nr:hypothetical protein [Alicycliphilus sp.]
MIVTRHQAFFTHEAMTTISRNTVKSIGEFLQGDALTEEVTFD